MKRFLSLLLVVLVAPAWAEPDYPVVYATSPEEPASAATPRTSGISQVGLSFGYGFNSSSGDTYTSNMFLAEAETAWLLNRYHALTATLHFAIGKEDHDGFRQDGQTRRYFTDNYDRSSLSLMLGYRFTAPLNPAVSLTLGTRGGIDLQNLKVDYGRNGRSYTHHHANWFDPDDEDTREREWTDETLALGLAYSAHASMAINMNYLLDINSENYRADLVIGYAIWGSTTQPTARLTGGAHPIKQRADTLLLQEIRAGISITF